MSESNDSLISCPPCQTPSRCLGLNGQCGMALDKALAVFATTPEAVALEEEHKGWCGNFEVCRCLHLHDDERLGCTYWHP